METLKIEILKEAIIAIDRPYFIFNKIEMRVKVYPTIVELGSKSITTFDPTTDEVVIRDTIEEVMVEFDRLGFQMPEENIWDFEEKEIRVTIKDGDLLSMLKSFPELISFLDTLKDFIINRNGNQIIYLSEIYPEHKQLFESFNANIETHGN